MNRTGGRSILVVLALLLLAAVPSAGFGQGTVFPRSDLVKAIKKYELEMLGYPIKTTTFSYYSDKVSAYYLCYLTGKLELPDSYEFIEHKKGNADGCGIDNKQYDVLFYPAEVLAEPDIPVTKSLADVALDRFIMVVLHEDFHLQITPLWQFPTINEAAATLVGNYAAAKFARMMYGDSNEVYRSLAQKAESYPIEAKITNQYFVRLSALYRDASFGKISRDEALAKKEQIFLEMAGECMLQILRNCHAADHGKNASLAFEHTYSKYYPLIDQLYRSQGQDLRRTIAVLVKVAAKKLDTEEEAVRYIKSFIVSTK